MRKKKLIWYYSIFLPDNFFLQTSLVVNEACLILYETCLFLHVTDLKLCEIDVMSYYFFQTEEDKKLQDDLNLLVERLSVSVITF